MSNYIGEKLKDIMSDKKELTLLIIMVISAGATEFTSNTSISSIFIPIVDSIVKIRIFTYTGRLISIIYFYFAKAAQLNMSPVYLLLPLILCVSLAFMLPVATPNNALIFANGYVKMKDMVIFLCF